MDRAKTAAWNFYVTRVNDIVTKQLSKFRAGASGPDLVLSPPTDEQVAIIERAMKDVALEAQQQSISAALCPVVRAIDAIDNSGRKAKVYACRSRAVLCA